MNKQSKGFSLVIVLITLVAIAALAFGGWFVWQKSQGSTDSKQNNASQNNTQKPNNNQNEPSDPYQGWGTYTNNQYGISFRYPDEWEIGKNEAVDFPDPNSPDDTSRTEYVIAMTREGLPTKHTASITIQDRTLGEAVNGYDKYYGAGQLFAIPKTYGESDGKKTVKYAHSTRSGLSDEQDVQILLIELGDKTLSFSTMDEKSNLEHDANYEAKFNKVLQSLTITAQ